MGEAATVTRTKSDCEIERQANERLLPFMRRGSMGNHKQVDGGFFNPPSIVLLLPFWSDDRRGETCLE